MPRTSTPPPPPDPEAGEHFSLASVTYQLRLVVCGKARCRCARGAAHGPYWYAFTWGHRGVRCSYVGKRLPPAVESARRGLLHVRPQEPRGGRSSSARVRSADRVVRGPQLELPPLPKGRHGSNLRLLNQQRKPKRKGPTP